MPEPRSDFSIDREIGYPLATAIAPSFISPNVITFLGYIPTVIAVKAVFEDDSVTLLGAVVVRTFIDLLDGATARKYNKSSPSGDIIDKGSDYIFIIAMFAAVAAKNNCCGILLLLCIASIVLYHVVPAVGTLIHDNTLVMVPLLIFILQHYSKTRAIL